VHKATRDHRGANTHLTSALELYRELDDRAGQAEALTHLGGVLLESSTPASARSRYEQALTIAAAITAPLLEACALEGIGRTYLSEEQPHQAAAPLRRALAIYQRMGSTHAHRVEVTLRDQGI
jgi:tetratricopeptide (TPR) repeat protein